MIGSTAGASAGPPAFISEGVLAVITSSRCATTLAAMAMTALPTIPSTRALPRKPTMLTIPQDYLDAARRSIEENYGSLPDYLAAAGVTAEDVGRVRAALLG